MRPLTRLAFNGRFSGTLEPTGTQTAAYNLFDAIIRHPARNFSIEVFADRQFPGIDEWETFSGINLVHVPFSEWSRGRAQRGGRGGREARHGVGREGKRNIPVFGSRQSMEQPAAGDFPDLKDRILAHARRRHQGPVG